MSQLTMDDATNSKDEALENTSECMSGKNTSDEGETSEVPLLSPSDSGGDGPQAQRDEDVKMSEDDNPKPKSVTGETDSGFKKPILGPFRKPSAIPDPETEGSLRAREMEASSSSNDNPDSVSDTVIPEAATAQSTEESDDKDGSKDFTVPVTATSRADHNEAPQKGTDMKKKSTSEKSQPQVSIPYLEPKWGGKAEKNYFLEVLKNGKIIDSVNLEKSYYVFGRLPQCDLSMEHPSLSRFHAVVQYCSEPSERHEEGWYVYDLESTHGTFINKRQVKPRTYYRLKVGYVLKFAGSSRLHILQGPPEDEEPESELTITQMKELKEKKKEEADLSNEDDEEDTSSKGDVDDTGCSWGMGEDAHEQELEIPSTDTVPQNEELYIEDPKKALKGYFEREGYDLPEYQFEEAGHGKHKCIVEVPVDSPSGQPVYAEAVVSGKRKDAVVACALEACRILDRYGLLRKKEHEARKAKTRDWEANDYYGSDEDEYFDRTGEIQKKRERRMKRAGKLTEKTETFESLSEKLAKVTEEMEHINKELEAARKVTSKLDGDGLDALDAYMTSIKEGAVDTKTKMALKRRLFDLKKEKGHLERLVNIARPATLKTSLSKGNSSISSMVGKIGGFKKSMAKPVPKSSAVKIEIAAAVSKKVSGVEKEPVEEMDTEDSVTAPSTKADSTKADSPARIPSLPAEVTASDVHETPDKVPTEKITTPKQSSNVPETTKVPNEGQSKKGQSKKRVSSSLQQTIKRLKGPEVKEKEISKDYCDNDPDYAVWVPPQGQTGDGKTHLNAKFGY